MGCCYSKGNRKIDATETETEGIIDKSDEFVFKVTGKKNLKLNFRINIEVNNQDDSGLKSSKPETSSEDSLNRNKVTDNDKEDQVIQINKDSFDDDYVFPTFFIEKYHNKRKQILKESECSSNANQEENFEKDALDSNRKYAYLDSNKHDSNENKNFLNIESFKFDNNKNLILNSASNLPYNETNLEAIGNYINPDPEFPNFANCSDSNSGNKKRKSLACIFKNTKEDQYNNLSVISNNDSSVVEHANNFQNNNLNNNNSNNNNSNNNSNNNNNNEYNSNFSMRDVNQASFNSMNLGRNSINSNSGFYNMSDFNTEKIQIYLPNFLPKKNFVFLYFEIINFNFCLKDYFKSIYPEMNLVLVLEINDSILSQEKIFFVKAHENIYHPIIKKGDLQYQDDSKINRYRIIKPVEISDENFPIKISFNFYSFTNQKLLSIGSEEFFFKINLENNLQKFYMYQNIHIKYVSKKIGNLSFNYCYKLDEIYSHNLHAETKNNFKCFTNLQNMKLFNDDYSLIFKYYNVTEDTSITFNNNCGSKGTSPELKLKQNSKAKELYFTIDEIEKVDITQELKNSDLKSDRLLELVDYKQSKEDFFALLKKIDSIIFKAELTLEKLNLFKEKLHRKLDEFQNYSFQSDIFIIPLMFSVLRKSFYRGRKEGELRRSSVQSEARANHPNSPVHDSGKKAKCSYYMQKTKESANAEKVHFTRNGHLLLESFKIIFGYVVKDYFEDILLSALNYIYRFFEDPISYEIDSKHYSTDNFLVECIVKNKLYITLCNLIVKYPEYQSCVQPSLDIILRIIKVKKNEMQELIDIINSEKFLNILKMIMVIHECNMKIINELLLIFFQIGEKGDLKNFTYLFSFGKLREIFNIFKMNGFDYIHEIIIRLLRQIITRKLNASIININNINPNNSSYSEQQKHRRNLNSNKPSAEDKNISNKNNKENLSTEESEQDPVYALTNDEFAEINFIFLNALQFIKNKINMFAEFIKSPKNVINFVTNINFMCDSLLAIIGKKPKKVAIMQNLKLVENFLSVVLLINESKFFFEMERFYASNDPSLINNKVLVLRMMHNLHKMTKSLKEMNHQAKENSVFKKYQNEFVKRIIKDNNYSPLYLNYIIDQNCSGLKNEKDENIKRNIKNIDFMYTEICNFYS